MTCLRTAVGTVTNDRRTKKDVHPAWSLANMLLILAVAGVSNLMLG